MVFYLFDFLSGRLVNFLVTTAHASHVLYKHCLSRGEGGREEAWCVLASLFFWPVCFIGKKFTQQSFCLPQFQSSFMKNAFLYMWLVHCLCLCFL